MLRRKHTPSSPSVGKSRKSREQQTEHVQGQDSQEPKQWTAPKAQVTSTRAKPQSFAPKRIATPPVNGWQRSSPTQSPCSSPTGVDHSRSVFSSSSDLTRPEQSARARGVQPVDASARPLSQVLPLVSQLQFPLRVTDAEETPATMETRRKGEFLLDSSSEADHIRGISLLLQAMGDGSGGACFKLGLACHKAQGGLPRDEMLAAQLWTEGAKRGNVDSFFALGCIYEMGRGVERDEEKALSCWQHAAQRGQKNAMFMYPYVRGDMESAAQDPGFASFVMRNVGTSKRKTKAPYSLDACMQIYAGAMRRKFTFN